MSRFRVAVGGLHTECSTSSPVLMTEADFRVLRGDDLLAAEYFAFLPEPDVTLLPLLHARAVPGGPVARDTYESFKRAFLTGLETSLPLDGLYLAMHGAVKVEGLDDAEGDWIAAARAVVGSDCLVAASYDLHGNLSQPIVDALDVLAAYRTAPHIDVRHTMQRAWAMLLGALRSGERPGIVWAPIPVLLPGERTSTVDEPARSLYAGLSAYDTRAGISDANLLVGYVWADEPRATAAAVVTGTDPDATEKAAAEIALAYWEARHAFRFGPATGRLEAMLDAAAAAATRPVILADSGDNPTGGGVGDRADVLAALHRRRWPGALVAGIADRPAVEACFAAGIGAEIALSLGATLDPASRPLDARVSVLTLDDPGPLLERQAVVRLLEADITVVLAARRRPYHTLADFHRLNLDPATARLLVVKSGYLSPELEPLANPNLMALTEGVVNQDIPRLENLRRPVPTFPFQTDFHFSPVARRSARWSRRGVS